MPVRLLHLSDIHFGCHDAGAFRAATQFARDNRFDLTVISGDITQVGAHDEFKSAAAWLEVLPGPLLATPGNHDTPWFGLIERVVDPFGRYARAIGPSESAQHLAPGLKVSAFNSARGWQVRLNWSKGHVSRDQTRKVSADLAAAPAGAYRIAVCHHPLLEEPGEPITSQVRGGHYAAQRLVEAGADIVLTGHLHVPFVQPLPYGDQRTYAVGAGTLSLRERGAPPGFNIIEIDGEDLTVTAMAWANEALAPARTWAVRLRPRTRPGGAS